MEKLKGGPGSSVEIPTTRAHIAEARARQTSSTEEHCVYLEHGPELQPFHYLRALDRLLGGTAGVIQISKRITVGNLPFFVEDSAIINALRPYGRITSIAPKMMKAGPYTYNDGRREAFIVLHEGVTTERLNITIKGEAWPAYLSSGIKCSRCHGQGHRRANCPLLAGRANNTGLAPPTSPAGVPPPTTPAPPQRSAAQPPAPAPSGPAMEIPGGSHAARAVTPSAAPRPSTPVAPAVPMEMAPPTPPPVAPAPSLRAPRSHEPAAPIPDIEMSIIEETSTSSTSSTRHSTREGLITFIERNPGVSFAETDALGLGREGVLDLLSSKTRARKQGPLLSPPQSDALAGLIGQLLNMRPGGSSNIYKVLGQVKAELRTALAAVPPTPPLPAPRPAETAPPDPQGEESAPAEVASPPPLPVRMTDEARRNWLLDLFKELNCKTFLAPLLCWNRPESIIYAALHSGETRNKILNAHPEQRNILANFLGSVIERARGGEDGFTVVKHKRRRRESPSRPVEQRSSGVAASRRTGATPRRRPNAGGATVIQEIRATRADIADARARQRSSTEDNCVFVEHCPDFGSTHYLQAVEELVGGAGNVLQVMKMDGHMLVGLSTKGLAERLIKDGPEIGHTYLRAFPFKKRAERITVGNFPFFVDDAAVIEALKPYGDVTSIVPIRLRAGRYTFTDGRREAFILLKEGIALENIPTRVVIRNKGNVLSAFISYGVKCSRCGRQGHRRANCPINPGRASNNGQPQPAPHPPAPSSKRLAPQTLAPGTSAALPARTSSDAVAPPLEPMEIAAEVLAPPTSNSAPQAVEPIEAPKAPADPRPPASQPAEEVPQALPASVAPPGPLHAQGTLVPPSPSSSGRKTRPDLEAFLKRNSGVSFARTDALGLGREKVLDLLSSKTKTHKHRPLLSPSQCDALAGMIKQILDLRPGGGSNIYKVLGQVKAELRTTPAAVPPTPPLPAPRPSELTPPTSHKEEQTPALMTPPPPAPTDMEEDDPMTEEERCAPPLPAPRLAEPTPPTPLGQETTLAMATPPPPLPHACSAVHILKAPPLPCLLPQEELESKCEACSRLPPNYSKGIV
ncbi:hypothetical protein LAZ67_3002209 [Cordylochernes scorpioides]|uniref:CCHC-type domain-containing protein n=1 Tax=Cordylochernes scorpioides TaxID=51811 RepID=A0ABY6K8H0_9ARAC|nr:hypothetical protein LAZ67_3002209 [Cordylochernes scorpioides]